MVIEKICGVAKLPITDVIGNKDIEGATFCGSQDYKGYLLYIISRDMDEKIEEGDWFMDKLNCNKPYQCKAVYEDRYITDTHIFQKNWCNKIIASNQLNLDVPRIPDSFKMEFCEKNGEIDEVMVKYESHCDRDGAIDKVCRTCKQFSFVPLLNFEGAYDKNGYRFIKQLITLKSTQSQWTRDEVEKKIWMFAREHGIHFQKTKKWIDKSF